MRVLVVSAYYPKHGGGIEIVAYELIKQLLHLDYRFTWCASQCDQAPAQIPGLVSTPLSSSNLIEDRLGIPYPLVGPKSILSLWKLVKLNDAVHLHDFIYASSFVAWLFARIQKKPVIITQHIGLVPYKNSLLRVLFKLVNHTLGRVMLSRSSQVVFIANHVHEYFSKICGGNRSNWHYIPNGVDTRVFNNIVNPDEIDSKLAQRLPKDQFVLFVGRFVEKKGLSFLKNLVHRTADIHWVFLGKGPIDPDSWGYSNVTTITHIEHENLAQIYRRASLLALPSVGEGFPLVIQEAVACGTPVLTTPETCHGCVDAEPFLFSLDIHSMNAPGNWEMKIRELLNKHEALKKVSADGALYAEEKWAWNSIRDQYDQVFRLARFQR